VQKAKGKNCGNTHTDPANAENWLSPQQIYPAVILDRLHGLRSPLHGEDRRERLSLPFGVKEAGLRCYTGREPPPFGIASKT
jgi:hypothetical protein